MKYYLVNPKTSTLISRHKTKELANDSKKDNYIVRKFENMESFKDMVDFASVRGSGAWTTYCLDEEK